MYAFDVATALESVPLMLRPPVRTGLRHCSLTDIFACRKCI